MRYCTPFPRGTRRACNVGCTSCQLFAPTPHPGHVRSKAPHSSPEAGWPAAAGVTSARCPAPRAAPGARPCSVCPHAVRLLVHVQHEEQQMNAITYTHARSHLAETMEKV